MIKIVISQPFFFPWIGLFEQIRLSDIYMHYDDVQFSKGSFVNRTRIKTLQGGKWITIPIHNPVFGSTIHQLKEHSRVWRQKALTFLSQNYAYSPYRRDMLDLVEATLQINNPSIADISMTSIHQVCLYYNISNPHSFLISSKMNIPGKNSERVLRIVKKCNADVYITGHGALHYLKHEDFESAQIRVEYMNYRCTPYPQLYGVFDPYVSILDLIANVGPKGKDWIHSGSLYWRDFIKQKRPINGPSKKRG